MCTQMCNYDPCNAELEAQPNSAICPMCRNIMKKQPAEHRYRLFSNSVVLSENIIVNQIDTQHLNTYAENAQMDPYTPESNESHSPYPELRSTTTSASSNSCKNEQSMDILNEDNEEQYSGQYAKVNVNANANDDLFSLQSVHPITKKQSRNSVTPVQLKSRLEDLQRMHTSERSEVAVRKGDVNNIDAMCTPKSLSNSPNRNPSIFSMCCTIH